MKVFISWSGKLSHEVAKLLNYWIPEVLQGIDTWVSHEDIDKGTVWFNDLGDQLAETTLGVVCLTRENMNSPWILFEAGALAKGLSQNRVCPLLVDLASEDLKPPLSMFNATLPSKLEIVKLIETINSQNSDNVISKDRIARSFSRCWNDFETKFDKILKNHKPTKKHKARDPEDKLQEVLEIVRSLQRTQSSLKQKMQVESSPQTKRPMTVDADEAFAILLEKIEKKKLK